MNGEIDDYYAILGLDKNSSDQEIREAYRKMVKRYHPDKRLSYTKSSSTKDSNNGEMMIKKINLAFETLSDIKKRKQYDDKKEELKPSFTSDSGNIHAHDPHQTFFETEGDKTSHNQESTYFRSTKKTDRAKADRIGFDNRSNEKEPSPIPKSRFNITVDSSLCMAFGSCETLAPKVFEVNKDKLINPEAEVKSETGADFNTILDAAQTCPTKAISIIDRITGEQIYP